MRAQGSSNARSLATTAHCLYPAGPAKPKGQTRRVYFFVNEKGATRAPGVGVNRRYDIFPNRDCKMRDRCEV